MFSQYIILAFLAFSAVSIQGRTTGRKDTYAGCLFGLNEHLPKKNEPLLLVRGTDKSLALAMPETNGKVGSVSLREGEELVIACPGGKNMISVTGKEASRGLCSSNDIVKVDGAGEVSMGKLDCKNRAAASLRDTKQKCARGKGTIVEVGFDVEKWHKLSDSCHNKEDSVTYYSTHILYGSSLAGKVIQSFRPGFSRGDKAFFKGFNPEQAYNQNNQNEVFQSLFGSKLTEKYLDSKKSFFLARGHLAPDADFLYGTWQLSTYFYINVAPQWQSINAGYWLGVENAVRKLASNMGTDVEVATGTHGILSLPDGKGQLKEIYLEAGKRLPIPEWYWKVVRDPLTSSCMAVVSTNNPFLDKPPKTICNDICSQHGWPEFKNELNKGYVYCCTYQDLKKAVVDVPDYECKSILKYQK